jgi:hypothetical protein
VANLRARELQGTGAIGRNRRRIKVFLEGKDDFALFSMYWFPEEKDKVEFCKAEDGPVKQSGCRGVLANVRHQRESTGTQAFGIVDRDALLTENLFSEVSETDDQAFLENNLQRNPYVYCTLFWEIENYLIAAREMEQIRCDSQNHPEPCRPEDIVNQELREHCDALVPHSAINACRHEYGKVKVNDGSTNEHETRAEVDAFFRENLLASAAPEEVQRYEQWVDSVLAFDDANKADHERTRLMQRRIHGKALLQRFFRRRNIQNEVRWHLARQCTKPLEIEAKLQDWINS